MKISVAMAAYNGESYIRQQINSIISQLGRDDELIISCNESTDATESIAKDCASRDDRIKVFSCGEKGVIPNFENAIRNSCGDVIVLSDQDDVWDEGKLAITRRIFEKKNPVLMLHNARFTDGELRPTETDLFNLKHVSKGVIRNIIKNSYMGCCMAFKRELLKAALPIPRDVAMHDQWIGIIAESISPKKVVMVNKCLVNYRRHEAAATDGAHLTPKRKIHDIWIISGRLWERRKKLKKEGLE